MVIIDPFYEREKEKYVDPIVSRECILEYLSQKDHLVTYEELITVFDLKSPEQLEAFQKRLRAMERDGQLVSNRAGEYGLIKKMNLVRGRVVAHRDGYGFVICDDGGKDLFLSARQMRVLFDGDRVLVRILRTDRRGRLEVGVVQILERHIPKVVGKFFREGGVGFVQSINKKIQHTIVIPPQEERDAKPDQLVVVEIITPPSEHNQPIGKIVEVLGNDLAPGMEINVAIRAYDLPYVWSEEALKEAGLVAQIKKEEEKRVDCRHLPFVTIDGEDAQDFDDAVHCIPRTSAKGGWRLYVAIADVSHYVAPGSVLDQVALERGNSVYFPGKVIPMLPEVLSNDLCSLKPNTDRLCIVCDMSITQTGKLTSYKFYPAIIHSKARLTYTQVADWLQAKEAPPAHANLYPYLEELKKLFDVLHQQREKRGALDFDILESKIIFGGQRKIKKIIPLERNIAHQIIEECMLMANVAAARFLLKHNIPGLFRNHAGPIADKLFDLRRFLKVLGLELKGGANPKPRDYSHLLKNLAQRKDMHIMQKILLRSLSQAVYAAQSIGHFGLAFEHYTHFTSPIRRYPDLLVHRAIRYILNNGKREKFFYDKDKMAQYGEYCSITERRADEAVRDAISSLKCQYMSAHIGKEFMGVITNVTSFGFFVEISDLLIEGLVHIGNLANDYYHFDPVFYRLQGNRTGQSYSLGDYVKIQVLNVNLNEKFIDFGLVQGKKITSKKKKISSKASK